MVLDGEAELAEDAADASGTQRRRSHQGSGLRGPDLDGDPEQGDAWLDSFGFGHQRDFQGPNEGDALRHYALKYAICVVVASRRPEGDHNSPCWSP